MVDTVRKHTLACVVRISTVSIDPAVIRVQSPAAVKVQAGGACGEGTDFELTIPEAIVAHEEYRVEDQMQMIVERLLASEDGATDFEDLFLTGTRDELVATFLALLELIRRRVIIVRQPMLFGPIRVELREKEAATKLFSASEKEG